MSSNILSVNRIQNLNDQIETNFLEFHDRKKLRIDFLKEQANESLLHAQQAGEILTGLDGHPTQNIA